MSRMIRIGDQIHIKGTQHQGEVVGTATTLDMFVDKELPRAYPDHSWVIRLTNPFIVTMNDKIERNRPPSSLPGSLFIYEVVKHESELELLSQ